tara:strand:+ start:486 stop:734 length:249 start_codon:yes stop_codon:yes gene_type:complete
MVRETGEKHHNRQQMVYDLEMSGYKAGEDFIVMNVPNIVNITYGRDVGYKIEQESFSHEIEEISATKIREEIDRVALLGDER